MDAHYLFAHVSFSFYIATIYPDHMATYLVTKLLYEEFY